MVKAPGTTVNVTNAKQPETETPAIATIKPSKTPQISSVPVQQLIEPDVINILRPIGTGEGNLPPGVVRAEIVRALKQGYRLVTAQALGYEPNMVAVYFCLVRY